MRKLVLIVVLLIINSSSEIFAQNFGLSDPSQTNSICGPEGGEGGIFEDQIRSVVIVKIPANTKNIKDNQVYTEITYGSGVLVNNTNNDGEMYILTDTHNLPSLDNIDKLSEYQFIFEYESPICKPTSKPVPSIILQGCTLVASDRFSFPNFEPFLNSDISLLKLNHKIPSDVAKIYFSGWNLNVPSLDDDFTLIHHPKGDVKKIATFNILKNTNLYFGGGNPLTVSKIPFTSSVKDMEPYRFFYTDTANFSGGFSEGGSSGSPTYNSDNQIIGLLGGSLRVTRLMPAEPFFTWFNKLSYAWKWGDTNSKFDMVGGKNTFNIGDFLSPSDTTTLELDGCYPCAAGTRGLTLNEQNRYLKTLEVSEDIPGDKSQSFVAQDEIKISSIIRPGARISFAAEQVLLGEGTNFERGSEVEITSGIKNGLGCATGCYNIIIPPNPEHILSKSSCYMYGVKNAKNYSVKITLANGNIINLKSKPVHGSPINLFDFLDLNVNAWVIKYTRATVEVTFTNDCDTAKKITFQVFFDGSIIDDNAFLSDYFHYKFDSKHGGKMPSIETYMANKKALTQWYQPAPSFQTTTAQHSEDVLFEIGVEKDITFAKASGYEWSFRGGKGYRSINPAITTGNGESLSHLTQLIGVHKFVKDGRLKMDIYYPKLKQGVTATEAPALPVICYVFGGGYVTHDQPELGDEICRWFAGKGYIVAFIDYRIGADLTNAEVSKRAPMRAWQDVNAAVQFLRMQGQKQVTVSDKWRINPKKIFGNGWSAGAIACLHNLTLNKTQYENERINGNFLEFTKGNKSYTSLTLPYNTYDLEAYPTIPCKPGETDCTGSDVDAQFNAVGVFAGAIGKPDWINNIERPAIDIHHHDDEIVLWGKGVPFKNVSPKTNFIKLTQVPSLYGGGYLKENYPNKTKFDVVTLDKEWQAGGKPEGFSLGKHHASMIKWGDVAGVDSPPRLEIKEMFLLDGFFMNQSSTSLRIASPDTNLNSNEYQDVRSKNMVLYPNPSDGKFDLDFFLNKAGLVSFKIADINGKFVFKQKNNLFNKGNNKFSFDLANKLPSGLYLLKVTSDEFSESIKIIIK